MDEILLAFLEDAGELLRTMEAGLLQLEEGAAQGETLNSIFRAAHTLKGDAGIVEQPHVARFAHLMENYLDMVRQGELPLTKPFITRMLRCCDHLASLLFHAGSASHEAMPALLACGDALALELQGLVESSAPADAPLFAGSQEGAVLPEACEHELTPVHSPMPAGVASSTAGSVPVQEIRPLPEGSAVSDSQSPLAARKSDDPRQIRVQAEKLDQLIDLVGEMVVSSSAASMMARQSGHSGMLEANAALARLIENMRELSLQLRMVQVGEVFNRFRRVVRDMAHDTGREIELSIRGEDTELDKGVVEKIADPIMHLVRNAIDHGIEPEAVRLARGKPAAGRIELSACHETGGIVIEVADDGAGLDRERILAKALQRGLVQEGQILSDQEIYRLIFVAGFSTAERVTSLSGRGVGMDVVRSNIEALRGSIDVQTVAGQGCRFVIRLPLTMAIIDGFQVGVDRNAYIVPLDMVVECVEFRQENAAGRVVNLRGRALPCLRLREFFGLDGNSPMRENVVVVRFGGREAGIVVDQLQGECQTVIKPLARLFRHVRGIAGSTILGTGDVALILDVPALIAMAERRELVPPGAPD